MKNVAYTLLVRPILEFGATSWYPFTEVQINTLVRVQKKAAKFANLTKESNWEKFAHRRKIARVCAVYRATPKDRLGRL